MDLELNRGIWKNELPDRDFKSISSSVIRKFGLQSDSTQPVVHMEELRNSPPNIIIGEVLKDFRFTQNYFKEQTLKKRNRYIMGLGVFQQLQYAHNHSKMKLVKPSKIKFKNIYKPYVGQDLTNKKILVFRTGGIGDLLFIQPNLIYLKEKYPTCYIKFACGPQYQPMVENWDCIDELLDLPFTFTSLASCDYHILFEGVIERCYEAQTTNAYNLFSRWLGLDLPDELLVPKQEPQEELVEECSKILEDWKLDKKSFVVMQLRASSPIRTPRHEFWVKIVNELHLRGYNVLLTDNPIQAPNIDSFIKLLDKPEMAFNFCKHSKSIAYTIAITSLSLATIATDSALSHIAASLDKKCFGVYGPFPGSIRFKTYPKSLWVDAKRHCAPCFLHSQKPCQYAVDGYSPCYDELINTDEKLKGVINKFEDLING